MATKNTPKIQAVIPHGPGNPERRLPALDQLDQANTVMSDLNRQQNEMAHRHGVQVYAEKAQLRVQSFKRYGFPELDELPEPTGEQYRRRPIYRTSDGRTWLLISITDPQPGSTDGPIGRRGEYVTYIDSEIEGVRFTDALEWNRLTDAELAEMRTRDEKDAAEHDEVEAAREAANKILFKATRHPWTTESSAWMGNQDLTLDQVEGLMAQTNAKVTNVGVNGCLVSAPRQAELVAAVPATAPRFMAKQFQHHDASVDQLVYCLGELKELAVQWSRLKGKRPLSDDGSNLPANRLGPNGVFLP